MTRYSWTQPICDDCWDREHPDRPSPRHAAGMPAQCVHCAEPTLSGIYVRIDPTKANYPSNEK